MDEKKGFIEEDQDQDQDQDQVDECSISILLWVSNMFHKLRECCFGIYRSNDMIRSTIDKISYCSTLTYNTICSKRTEPIEMHWGSACRMIEYGQLEECFIVNSYSEALTIQIGDFLIYRNDDYIICCQSKIIDLVQQPTLSEIRFLSIEYNHPEMSEPIQLVLEKEWFVVGNEVLGQIHILRMLEYQFSKSEYVFDERYFVKIIDTNINILEIGSGEYIRLGIDGYDVIG